MRGVVLGMMVVEELHPSFGYTDHHKRDACSRVLWLWEISPLDAIYAAVVGPYTVAAVEQNVILNSTQPGNCLSTG